MSKKRKDPPRIFSGEESTELWEMIQEVSRKLAGQVPAKYGDVLYIFGCKCQELESRLEKLEEATRASAQPVAGPLKGKSNE